MDRSVLPGLMKLPDFSNGSLLLRDGRYRETAGQVAFEACHVRFSWDRLLSAADPAIFAGQGAAGPGATPPSGSVL